MDKGYPWDSYQGDVREYGAQDMANAFGKIIKNGVVNRLTDFLVSPQTGNVVRVGAGQAWINGHTVSVLGFEDVEIPFGGEVTGAKTYGRLVLQARDETAYRDFQIVYKPPVNDASPEVADNEISLAYVASKRTEVTVSTDDIIRDVTAAACVNSDIVAGDYTDISGLLKGEYGKIARAVPGTDYAPSLKTGLWVPSPDGNDFTVSSGAGNYAKLDKLVFVSFKINVGMTKDTGYIYLKGLPFRPKGQLTTQVGLFIGMTHFISTTPTLDRFPYQSTYPKISEAQGAYTDRILINYTTSAGGTQSLAGSWFLDNSTPTASMSYMASLLYITDE